MTVVMGLLLLLLLLLLSVGQQRKWQRDCDGQRQLLRLSASAIFILPLFVCIARIGHTLQLMFFVLNKTETSV